MKDIYEAPQVQVLEMEVQGMLAQSPGNGTLGKPDDYGNGGDGFTF